MNNEWISLGQVVPYLSKVMQIDRTRQTVHNWAVVGVQRGLGDRILLRTEKRAGQRYTKREWVREFVDAISV
jgi:hypothetical protein